MSSPIATSEIAGQAFRFMELSEISSFADDTPQAQAAAKQYPVALRACLEAQDWSFARRLVALPEVSVLPSDRAPDPDLTSAYKLPGDTIKLRLVIPDTVRWRLDESYLFTDQAGGQTIRYTRLIDNESKMPAVFQTSVALQLAVFLAPRFVGSRTKRADLRDELARTLRASVEHDAHSASAHSWRDGGVASGDWVTEATR